MVYSGGFRGGSRGSLEPPSGPTLFRFHVEFQKILCEIRQTNPPFLHLNPLFRNPGSAPGIQRFLRRSLQFLSPLTKITYLGLHFIYLKMLPCAPRRSNDVSKFDYNISAMLQAIASISLACEFLATVTLI